MNVIKLHGKLGEVFGTEFKLSVKTPAEAFRALAVQLPGFSQMVQAGAFELVRGVEIETGTYDSEETLHFPMGSNRTFHIVPAIAGAKSGGLGKAILGAVIMVAAVATSPFTGGTSFAAAMAANSAIFGITYGAFFMFGLSLMFMGVASMLQPAVQSNYDAREKADSRPSFFLGGQLNRVEQGGPVPLAYGRIRIGSTVISAGLSAESF